MYELLSPDAVARGQRGAEAEIRGPEEFAKFVREIRGAFPDIQVSVEDVFGADDKVVLRWSGVMTHTEMPWGSRQAAGLCAVAVSQSLALWMEGSSRVGTTGINSECSNKSAYTSSPSQRKRSSRIMGSIRRTRTRLENGDAEAGNWSMAKRHRRIHRQFNK